MNHSVKKSVVQLLEKLGLSEAEGQLYTLLLRYPQSTVQELQTRSPLPRTMLYYVLNNLAQRGLVTAVREKKRTRYIVEDPERLYDVLDEQEHEFTQTSKAVRQMIPLLKSNFRLASQRPGVRLLEGLDGYQKALEEILISNPKQIDAYGGLPHSKKPGIEIRETYEHKRLNRKILKRVLLGNSHQVQKQLLQMRYDDHTQYRFANEYLSACDVDMQLYSGKIFYTTFTDREPMTIVIEDQQLYTFQKMIFDFFWSKSKDATQLLFTAKNV